MTRSRGAHRAWSPHRVLDAPCTPRPSPCDTERVPDDEYPWLERKTGRFTLLMLVGADGVDPIDDNIDVEPGTRRGGRTMGRHRLHAGES